jgi:ATP-dependent Clp protease ATP-binding subunit ClpX
MAARAKSIRLTGSGSKARLRTIGTWGERPLEDLTVVCHASTAVDKLIRQTVAEARKQGCSWAEIGHALRITKQSAWERFSGEE